MDHVTILHGHRAELCWGGRDGQTSLVEVQCIISTQSGTVTVLSTFPQGTSWVALIKQRVVCCHSAGLLQSGTRRSRKMSNIIPCVNQKSGCNMLSLLYFFKNIMNQEPHSFGFVTKPFVSHQMHSLEVVSDRWMQCQLGGPCPAPVPS